MKNYAKEMSDKAYIAIIVFVAVAFFLTYFGLSQYIDFASKILYSVVFGIIATGCAQVILQAFSGDILEKIPITITIKGYDFKVSLFVVFTIILKLLIFR